MKAELSKRKCLVLYQNKNSPIFKKINERGITYARNIYGTFACASFDPASVEPLSPQSTCIKLKFSSSVLVFSDPVHLITPATQWQI